MQDINAIIINSTNILPIFKDFNDERMFLLWKQYFYDIKAYFSVYLIQNVHAKY